MNSLLDRKRLKQYLITAIITSIVVISLSLAFELGLMFHIEDKVNSDELKMANLPKFCTIEELEKRLAKEKTNYFVSIRLAQIYESLSENKIANDYYQRALRQSGRSNFALYNYALFSAKQGLYALSTTLGEELTGNTKTNLKYKAEIYEQIGDNLDKEGQFLAGIKAYQISYKYRKTLRNKEDFSRIESKLVNEYVKLADESIKNDKVNDAIFNLENALKIKDAPLAKYKLALTYRDSDKYKAEKLMAQVFKTDPFLVNPYIYDSLLEELVKLSRYDDNENSESYYTLRLQNFKKKLSRLYIYKDDLEFENCAIVKKWSFLSKNNTLSLAYDLKNLTPNKLNSLFLRFEIIQGEDKYEVFSHPTSDARPLEAYEVLKHQRVLLPKELISKKNQIQNRAILKYYARVHKNAPWTLIKIDIINI